MNAIILRPLNVPHAQSLYTIEQGKGDDPSQSYPDYRDLRDRNQTFLGIAAYSITRAALDTNGKAASAWLYQASGNYFDVLDIQPLAVFSIARMSTVRTALPTWCSAIHTGGITSRAIPARSATSR